MEQCSFSGSRRRAYGLILQGKVFMSDEKHKMFSRDQLPVDAADWKGITIDFPRLSDDTVESCPLPIDDVMEYIK